MKRSGVLIAVIAVALVASSSYAGEPVMIAGTLTQTVSSQDSIVVGDPDGHFMYLTEYTGTNASTGDAEFMHNAETHNMEFSDFAHGNGMHRGHFRFDKDGMSVYATWEGKIKTVLAEDSSYVTKVKGTFTMTGGTGAFKGIKGNGTYNATATAGSPEVVEWSGQYTIEK